MAFRVYCGILRHTCILPWIMLKRRLKGEAAVNAQKECKGLVTSPGRRLEAVAAKKGFLTKYEVAFLCCASGPKVRT